jgi:hypothetical protein
MGELRVFHIFFDSRARLQLDCNLVAATH